MTKFKFTLKGYKVTANSLEIAKYCRSLVETQIDNYIYNFSSVNLEKVMNIVKSEYMVRKWTSLGLLSINRN